MEERRVASFSIDVFADNANAKDVVTGILHTIFWYRIFANLEPSSHDVLDVPVPWIQDVDLQTLVEQRVDQFVRQIDADSNDQNQNTRGQMVVQFSERERRRKKGWFGQKDEDLVWETWTLNIALASPRTHQEATTSRRAIEKSLSNAILKITDIVQQNKDHVPPITTQDTNTFPYHILVNPKNDGWGQRMGIF
ncbi:DUF1649-domain-containing protein [Aureobasidium pullulans]|uniref:Autophagy-related protein 101 n=1 Tax=Aureobasidium pullulans TaxID=5580 RepID=A0A4S8Y970_AURPU|nr:DUF1649-domain-containing protein [Aureobasidium pullulans]